MTQPLGLSVLTLRGLEAYQAASAVGASVQPVTYQFSNLEYDLAAEGLGLTELAGVWREAAISGYFAVDRDTVEFLVDVPPDEAVDYGRTCGLYLADGTLFLVAAPPFAFPPAFHQRFKIQLRYGNAAALTDFQYLPFQETSQDLVTLGHKATSNLQVLRNARELGLLKHHQYRRR